MIENKNTKKALTALVAATITWIILNVLAMMFPEGESINNFIRGIGGTASSSSIIQFICYGLFFYTLQELNERNSTLEREHNAFQDDCVPLTEYAVLKSQEEVAAVKLKVIEKEKEDKQQYIIRDLIKQVCNQYRNNKSVVEAYQVLEYQVKSTKMIEEAKLEFTRYTLRAIEMLGLIGTVIGLTQAIGKSGGMLQLDQVAKEQSLLDIISNFSMAFGTTLVAIVLGLILAQKYHSYLAKMDTFMAKTEKFVINNLVNRIMDPKAIKN